MKNLLKRAFGFNDIELKELGGYDNVNYLLTTNKGQFIFKTYPFDKELLAMLLAETKALLFLDETHSGQISKPISSLDGHFVKTVELNGQQQIVRLLSYLQGELLGKGAKSKELFHSIGMFLAHLDTKLQDYQDDTIQAREWRWDLQYFHLNEPLIEAIADVKDQKIIRHFFQQYKEHAIPVFPELRKSIIHNDANEGNVLVQNGMVVGLIDFGDLSHTYLINELAIAIAYACFDKENPLEWASYLLAAYHEILPIEEKEVQVLYYLVAARLCTSLCNSAHAAIHDPNNEHALISQQPAWKMLHQWKRISPEIAEKTFRLAIGLP